jgi:hypothetical protein
LDLSFNFFGAESTLEPVVALPRLLKLLIFGNPVLGPTGEDPMLIYIEALVEQACLCRDRTPMKDIDVGNAPCSSVGNATTTEYIVLFCSFRVPALLPQTVAVYFILCRIVFYIYFNLFLFSLLRKFPRNEI